MGTGLRAAGGGLDSRARATSGLASPDTAIGAIRTLGAFLGVWRRHRLHRALAALPLFSACSRTDLQRIARRGEVVDVAGGAALLREDKTDYWLYVVLAGAVRLTRAGREVAVLRRGGHVGEEAIVGWGLQSSTAVASEPCLLFVLGRRDVVNFSYTMDGFRRALFGVAGREAFDALASRLRDEGNAAWDRLAAKWRLSLPAPDTLRPLLVPGRPVRTGDLEVLATRALRPDAVPAASPSPPVRELARRTKAVLLAVAALSAIAFSLLYHPPFVVVGSAPAIDVVDEITVEGRTVDRPHGRYLLVAARLDRRTLAGTAAALVLRKRIVRAAADSSSEEVTRLGREWYQLSERTAVTVAARVLGLDPKTLSVSFRERDVRGGSAGLVFALALVDMLDPDDLARGRVIAATGALDESGRVGPVGFVDMKAVAARSAGASLFLVPRRLEPRAKGIVTAVHGVSSLDEAVGLLRAR